MMPLKIINGLHVVVGIGGAPLQVRDMGVVKGNSARVSLIGTAVTCFLSLNL